MSDAAVSTGDPPAKRRPEDYKFLKAIGEGSFSTVYLCREVTTRRFFAIKVCRKQLIIKEKKVEYVKREKVAYQILDGNAKPSRPFFLKLACSFQDASCLYYTLSLAERGDLLQYLTKNGAMDVPCAR
jgi:3-phosphoinositide dependent protein kinase-1